jgi:hypothetical protein
VARIGRTRIRQSAVDSRITQGSLTSFRIHQPSHLSQKGDTTVTSRAKSCGHILFRRSIRPFLVSCFLIRRQSSGMWRLHEHGAGSEPAERTSVLWPSSVSLRGRTVLQYQRAHAYPHAHISFLSHPPPHSHIFVTSCSFDHFAWHHIRTPPGGSMCPARVIAA